MSLHHGSALWVCTMGLYYGSAPMACEQTIDSAYLLLALRFNLAE